MSRWTIMALMASCLFMVSCVMDEFNEDSSVQTYHYEFTAVNPELSKLSVDGLSDKIWTMTWDKGDNLGVYKEDGTFVGVATMNSSSAGMNRGVFSLETSVSLKSGDDLRIFYPYVENAGIGECQIPAKQTVGNASSFGAKSHAVAHASAKYVPDNTEFTLSYANAYLRVKLKSSEYAGYTLEGCTLWAEGATLSGQANISSDGSLSIEKSEDYVKSMLSAPVEMSAAEQTVWLSALPSDDLSGRSVYIIAHMSKGNETVTVPVRVRGADRLRSGVVTTVSLPPLSRSQCPSWYEPVETRYVAANGDGWCYGCDNTVVFTSMTDPQTVDLKPRGNFRMVRQPKYVRIRYLNGLNDCTDPKGVQINGIQATTYASGEGEEIFTPVEVDNTCSVSVVLDNHKYLSSALGSVGYISAMEVLDGDMNVVWGINLWLTLKQITTVQYDNGAVMDRNLGSDEAGDANTWRATGNYFQWGRPWAIQSHSNIYSRKYFTCAEATDVTSLSVSAANPYTLYFYYMEGSNVGSDGEDTGGDSGTLNKDWYYGDGTPDRNNDLDDLWGNPNGHYKTGVKSIYDPCPKGWRVPDMVLLEEVQNNAEYITDVDYPYLSYRGVSWGFAGCYTCDGWNGGYNWKASPLYCAYWSNSNVYESGFALCMFGGITEEDGNKNLWFDTTYSKARAMPIRCMVDTENR